MLDYCSVEPREILVYQDKYTHNKLNIYSNKDKHKLIQNLRLTI